MIIGLPTASVFAALHTQPNSTENGKIGGIPAASGGYVYIAGIRWQVIGISDTKWLLMSADVLNAPMTWVEAKSYSDTVYNAFSALEKATTIETYKMDFPDDSTGYSYWYHNDEKDYDRYLGDASLNGERMFLLSAEEAVYYFDNSDEARKPGPWWLRSPDDYLDNFAGYIAYDGTLHEGDTIYLGISGARPAFQFSLESVLFLSAAEGGKSSGDAGVSALTEVGTNSTSEWKVTLRDDARKGFSASGTLTDTGVSVSYSGAQTGEKEYVSAVIKDKDGNITYYGKLKNCASADDAAGTAEITLDGIFRAGDTLYVFNEQCNGDKETDYASPLIYIPYDYSMSMGTDVLAKEANTDAAPTVWYAGNSWRVIGYNNEGNPYAAQDGVATLFSSGLLASKQQFNAYTGTETDNDYAGSKLQTAVDNLYATLFSAAEKKAVEKRTLGVEEYKSSEPYSNGVSGTATEGCLWPLSTAEAVAIGGYSELLKASDYWWLRSPGLYDDDVAEVYGDGFVANFGYDVNDSDSVRPAFYLNLESVLFTSAAAGGKSSGTVDADALTAVGTNSANEWKVTLKDSDHSGFTAKAASAIKEDGSIDITYSGAKTGDNEYISAIITDSKGNVTYYGRIAKASGSGTVTVNTSGKLGENDTLYVFNEQFNGDKTGDSAAKTDFASELKEITPLKDSTVTVSAADVKCEQDAAVSVTIPSDATGTVTVTVTGPDNKAADYNVTIAEADGGKGTLTLTKPAAGQYSITAVFAGDGQYASSSTASAVTFTVAAHEWKFVDFSWTGNETDGYTKAVANYECENDSSHTTTADANITETVTDPTTTAEGKTTYTANVTAENSPDKAPHCSTDTNEDKEAKVTDKIVYTFSKGDGSKWTKGSSSTLDFTVNRSVADESTFGRVQEIKVDGKALEDPDIKTSSGSLNGSLQPAYLETLSEGTHKLVVTFDDGDSPEMAFTIEAKPADNSVNTGDNNHLLLWVVLMASALAGGISIVIVARKRRGQ
ncbi:MAG: Ig-like domain repeat protein [Lachnospiraceae bacterium]|nr:Ig-like domain repeat protein [Lachnospiraceae bacterium]